MEMERAQSGGEAFVTLLSSRSYYPGVVALARSLRQFSARELLVLTTPGDISEHQRLELEAVGSDIRVVPVERVPPPEGATPFDPSHLDCFTKFRMFELKDYTKFVYLDADMLVVGDVDELFTYPSFAAAPNFQLKQNRRGMNVSKFSDSSFNAGLFVVDRDEGLHRQFLDHYAHYNKAWSWADQSLLNDFFKGGKWNQVPHYYNMMKRCFLYRPDLWEVDKIKIIHYTGGKPWQTPAEWKEKDFEDNTPYEPLFALWRDAHAGRFPLTVPQAPSSNSRTSP